jgi:60 kDa SS-A/Ro ribonucleoprotein
MSNRYAATFSTRKTPQTQAIPGAKTPQVRNSAGGFSWAVDDWTRLDRFLVLGVESATYYASAKKLTLENAEAVARCIDADGVRAVSRIVEISQAGRAPKNDPAIFALAMALKLGDLATRQAARAAVAKVCRIGTHLFQLAECVKAFGGWGRGTRGAFADWYAGLPADRLAWQAMKYQQRGGWSHRDLLRKCHARPSDEERDAVFRWIVRGWEGELPSEKPGDATGALWAFEQAKRAESAKAVARLIREHGLPRECVPTRFLDDLGVWEALLYAGGGMPMTAMLRNLGKMSQIGLLKGGSAAVRFVCDRLGDAEALRRARIHPLAALVALNTYRAGHGVRGSLQWRAVTRVVDSLDQAFYLSFGNVPSSGRRWMLSLDVSGSMSCGTIAGLPGITPRVGSAAMSLVTANVEQEHLFMAFSHKLVPLNISPRQRLDDVVRSVSGLPFGGTDCALPMIHALKERIPVDVFVVYTDSETWHGSIHPSQALVEYRQKMGINAKLIVVGMLANKFSIADPNDRGQLDIVGFDTAAPDLMRQFAIE